MTVLHQIGNQLVDESELRTLRRQASWAKADVPMSLAATAAAMMTASTQPTTGFTPIGIGRPLSIEIRYVWLGEQPEEDGWGLGNQDLLLSSAVKGTEAYDAAPRAINLIRPNVRKYSSVTSPVATERGTFVVYYTPALSRQGTTVSCELAFTDDAAEIVSEIGNLIGQAGSLPVFLPAATYLLTASQLLKISSVVLNRLRALKRARQFVSPITFSIPGRIDSFAGYKLLLPTYVRPEVARTLQETLSVTLDAGTGTEIVIEKASGEPYAGPVPVIVLAVDGAGRMDLASFQPTAAAADVLERFFGKAESTSLTIDAIAKGLALYSDFALRERATRLKAAFDAATDPTEKAKLKEEYNAVVKNIAESGLRPPEIT